MDSGQESESYSTTRRAVLGATAVGAAGLTSGCLRRVRTLMARDTPEQVTLDIKTVPSDEDFAAIQIARMLEEHLSAIGVDTDLVLMREDEFRREILINHDYDIFVGRFPDYYDPDFLRPLLHSEFANESGWANPYDFTNLDLDDMLVKQRAQEGPSRHETVAELQHTIVREQPFTVVIMPHEVRGVRTDRFTGWDTFPLSSPLSYIALGRQRDEDAQLRVSSTDARMTRNLNPLAVEYRDRGTFTGLLYDPLAHQIDGEMVPWLAEDWTFEEGEETIATVTLRSDLRWHDGSDITADDVAFTYEFLSDTTLGERDMRVPAPRFQGRTSLVDSIRALDDQRIRLSFDETSLEVAQRALTIPIFPDSEWEEKSSPAEIAGVSASEHVTEALVWSNLPPVGSGVLEYDDNTSGEQLVLKRFDDHFLNRNPPAELADQFGDSLAFDEFVLNTVGSDEAAVELLDSDEADVTVTSVNPSIIPDIDEAEEAERQVNISRSFYMIGYNTGRGPLGNPHFRNTVGRLVDKAHVANEVFDGYATPATSPLAGTDWVPPELQWDDGDPEVPFFGSGGELDEDAARAALEDVGFQFGEDGELLQP